MFEIGDSLREARTRRGFSAADVQKTIRIRERYLTALEEERWELLPGEAYTKGFLRQYAEFLGLNGNLYIDEYNARVAVHDEEPFVPDSLVASHGTRRGVLRTIMGIAVLGAIIAGLAAWGTGGSSKPPAKGTGPAVTHVAKSGAAAAAAPAGATPNAGPTAKPATLAKTTVIEAPRGRCWLSIRSGGPNGAIVFEGTLEQGKTLRFTLRHDLWVRMGAPTALDIMVGGKRVNGLPAQPGNVLLTRTGPQAA
jgi:Helix-turn-helix domain/RodZ C-terminal domain